jgi:hypothetical protein
VRIVGYTEVFFSKIFDAFLKIQKRAPVCLCAKAIFRMQACYKDLNNIFMMSWRREEVREKRGGLSCKS